MNVRIFTRDVAIPKTPGTIIPKKSTIQYLSQYKKKKNYNLKKMPVIA